jgi:hypothetical protein
MSFIFKRSPMVFYYYYFIIIIIILIKNFWGFLHSVLGTQGEQVGRFASMFMELGALEFIWRKSFRQNQKKNKCCF